MARTGLDDVRSLPDPLLSYAFDLLIPNIPGGGDTRALKIKCQSTSIPGVGVDPVTITLHGVDVKYAGRELFTHTLQVTFVETRDMTTLNALQNWVSHARNARANTGAYKADYTTEASILLYDDTGAVIRTIAMDGFYCEQVDVGALDGTSSTVVTISSTFSYDTHYVK